jgi:hypothetical protein
MVRSINVLTVWRFVIFELETSRMPSNSLQRTIARLSTLTEAQLGLLNGIIDTFERPIVAARPTSSRIISDEFLVAFGDVLKLHHSLSQDYLDKHRFEAAAERVFKALGFKASRPTNKCNPGHDLTVNGEAWSLKTQGDKGIKPDVLYISKFMELGKGRWEDENDLVGLRDQFLHHMQAYERIFQLRYFRSPAATGMEAGHHYELVEIPKSLLSEAKNGAIEMMHTSKQIPKPGYCTVTDKAGRVKFRLYFDGGTERKLQIKDLRKDLCIVHATWKY